MDGGREKPYWWRQSTVPTWSSFWTTGQRKLFKSMPVPEGLRPQNLLSPLFAPDLKVYSYTRIASDLYVVEGLT